MKRSRMLGICMVLSIFAMVISAHAVVDWDIVKTLKLDTPPLDMAVPSDGRSIFVLSESGNISIYSFKGILRDTIRVGTHVNSIRIGPWEDILLLGSRERNTVEILSYSFVQDVNILGSPSKGAPGAPVTMVVFSDYQ